MDAILKIKANGKHQLKIGKNEAPPPTIFSFDGLEIKNYDCQVELDKGTPVRIIVNGIDIPKNDALIQKKQEAQAKKQEAEDTEKQRQIEERRRPTVAKNGWEDSFKITETKLPKYLHGLGITTIDNFALKYYRASRFIGDKFHFFKNDQRFNKNTNETTGNKFMIQHEDFGNPNIFNRLKERNIKSAKTLFPNQLLEQTFKPNYRLVVGLGGHSVYETSMTLHHIYGIPYIPASSIKGVVRSWIISQLFQLTETELKNTKKEDIGNKQEDKALQCREFCEWFGCPAKSILGKSHKGNLTFFDAFPTETPRIEPDIMTVHYSKYYQGSEPPTDTQTPIPIPFLTVTKSPFLFLVGADEKLDIQSTKIDNKNIQEWLRSALTQHGIGAKTAIGYGYFQ